MRRVTLACLLALFTMAGVPATQAQVTVREVMAPPSPPVRMTEPMTAQDAARLVGEWEEYSPSRNFVDFRADGSVTLYLKRGEVGELKTMEGRWSRGDDGQLVLDFAILGQSFVQRVGIAWDGEELLMISELGGVTRHRRRTGELPPEYRW